MVGWGRVVREDGGFFFLKIIAQVDYGRLFISKIGSQRAERSSNEGWHRGSSCGAVSYFKSGRTILKVRQLRCWSEGRRGRIGVISHSPPLGQLHPRAVCKAAPALFSSYFSLLAPRLSLSLSVFLHALSHFSHSRTPLWNILCSSRNIHRSSTLSPLPTRACRLVKIARFYRNLV